MAVHIRKIEVLTSILCLVSLFVSGFGDRIKQKIYIDLETQSACFRILNGTQEVGCTSSMKGNVGTIHYMQDDSDYDWVLSKGPHDPYVAVLDGDKFTGENVHRLRKSGRVNGILVINTHNQTAGLPYPPWPQDGFSPLDKCPNDNYGMYSNNSEYKECQKGNWNNAGTSIGRVNLGMPVFALNTEQDVDNVLNKCFFPFNKNAKEKSTGYPVCAAEMKARMDAAVDSRVCIRRSKIFALSLSPQSAFCDPLGDHNVAATLMEKNDTVTRKDKSVIVVAAKLDATSLFLNEYVSADTSVAGVVTLLASAEALWKVKDAIRHEPNAKDIMYTFFQGETFDYIGSSRMVYDMRKDKFPQGPSSHASYQYLPQVKLAHIDQIVEVNQVGRRDDDDSLWAHTDPVGKPKDVRKVDQMIADLKSFGRDVSLSIKEPMTDRPLPPASTQSFLKHRLDIPSVVITDHKQDYTNKYYSSRFDLARFIQADDYPPNSNASVKYDYVTQQAELITNLSTTLAQYLYKASTGQAPNDTMKQALTADSSTVTHLLYCFLISPNCELFKESVEKSNEQSLTTAKAPFSFYVSVVNLHTNEVTQLVWAILARFTGDRLATDKDHCNAPSKEKRFSYVWMQGAKDPATGKREGWCIRSTVFYHLAKSPAFDIDGYDMTSSEYSTWTESVWGGQAINVRLFLIPSPELQLLTLCTGVVLLIVSFFLIFFISNNADLIFTSYTPPQAV